MPFILKHSVSIWRIEEGTVSTKLLPSVRTQILYQIKTGKLEADRIVFTRESEQEFNRIKPVISGIIWDEKEASAVISGKLYREGDPYKGIAVTRINKDSVDVVFAYKGKNFYYRLFCE